MKTSIRYLILTASILLLSCSVITPLSNNRGEGQATLTVSEVEHKFSNDDFSVEYSQDFYTLRQIWANNIKGQRDPEKDAVEVLEIGNAKPGSKGGYRYHISILERPYTNGQKLESIFEAAYQVVLTNYPEGFMKEETTLAGLDATSFTYKRPWGEPWYRFKDIWVVKGDMIYIFSYSAYPDHFDEGLKYFEEFLSSLKFR